jgi:hypothetical protein
VRRRADPPYPVMKITYDYLREYIDRENIGEDTINEYLILLDNNSFNIEYFNNNFVIQENL